ncbi:MAG: sel1 repeat family protein [Nitratireductor sp.]|nr:sel1 repeat family protein [Nitratireductor sp.]
MRRDLRTKGNEPVVSPLRLSALLAACLVLAGMGPARAVENAADGADSAATVGERMAPEIPAGGETSAADNNADAAYGAYQRGYYLTAFELALPRAQLGDPKAQTLIAELYDKGLGVARDPREATAWYEIASNNGDRDAQFGYAVKLLEGKYVKPDRVEARRLMKLAADDGHATAAFNYAQLVIDDRPTTAGAQEALPYLEQAAAARVSDAYYVLAQLYLSGRVKGYPEEQLALDWMLKAARAGIDTAQVELGIWLVNGFAGVRDEKAGFGWIRRAAIGGNVVARNRLAKLYAQGVGTEPDPVEAAKWHILAKRAGLKDTWLDDYINALDRQALARALEAANRWPG